MTEFISRRLPNVKNDILSGITVALALVPEAVAFAFVAGVDPLVGLYAAFMVGLITSVFGIRLILNVGRQRKREFFTG